MHDTQVFRCLPSSRPMTRKDPRWDAYLHERHSPEELRGWARSLAYFRFCRAFGGHANDGDCLRVALAVRRRAL